MRPARLAACVAASLLAAVPAVSQESGRDFDFYVLALSWSPGFCETTGASRNSSQCEPGRKLGFVVHGLWPQYERGYPSRCEGRNPPRYAMEAARDIYPDEGLARHEWRTHGACSGLAPTAYFEAVRRARAMVKVPEPLENLGQDGQTTPQNLERAFTQVNPSLRPDMIAVACREGALQEVRICIEKNLSGFRRCPEVDRAACRAPAIRVTAPR